MRYQREHPGELVHLDVKKLGRIPRGGGHRIHGRASGARGRGIGYDYLHSAIDDRSRVAFSQLLADEQAATAAGFLVEAAAFFADHGVVIQRVLTDNAKAYTDSVVFAETAAGLGIRCKRTRPYRPQTMRVDWRLSLGALVLDDTRRLRGWLPQTLPEVGPRR